MVVLGLAALGMTVTGALDAQVLAVAAICLPATLTSAWLGARAYGSVSEAAFQRIVLTLLLVSGAGLIVQALG